MEHVEQEQLRRFWQEIVSMSGPCRATDAGALVVTHLLPDRPFFLDALHRVAEIACVFPKPKSIDRTVLRRLRDRYPIEVADRAALADRDGIDTLLSRYGIDHRPLVAIDIGGYLAPAVAHLSASAPLVGVVEDTENGHQRYERELDPPFPCPVLSVARSPLKNAEDYLIGHSVVFSTEGLMRSRGDVLQGRSGCVIGYGKIGRSIAQLLRAHGVQVAVHDIDPVPLTEAHAHGFAVYDNLASALDGAGIVMCATGNLALRHQDFEHVQPGAYVASVTSSDDELELGPLKERYERNRVARDIVRYRRRLESRASGHYFFVLNNGEAVNFLHGAVVGPAIYLVQAEVLMAAARLLQRAYSETSNIVQLADADRAAIARIWLKHFDRRTHTMELDHIQQILGRYLAEFPAEHARILPLAQALADDASGSSVSRHSAAHITTGAVVVNLQSRTVLQVRHRRLNQWLLPGGHVEYSDRSLPEAAHRELAEEIGEAGRRASLAVDYPLDIDVHVIPAQPDRREQEHVHFDFRFVFTMSTGEVELATDEVEGFRWTALPALGVLGQRVGDVLDHG